jgi:hypothetical protein
VWWVLLVPVLVVEVVWVNRFLTRIRPRLRERLSHDLGVAIVDGPQGAWAAAPGIGLGRGVLVATVDIGLLILATLGPLAVVLLLVFLVAG